jgi:taurine dioxygenase
MSLTITPLSENAGAEVTGIDLRAPVDAAARARLNRAFLEYVVLVFPDQDLTARQFADASRIFGTPMRQLLKQYYVDGCPEVGVVSNRDCDAKGDGRILIRGTTWHTDHSNQAEPPKATALHAIAIPSKGGDTQITNTAAAYDALPDDMKRRIDGLLAVHTYLSSRTPRKLPERTAEERAATPDVTHPLVRVHPENGRKALYLNPVRIEGIVGMETGKAFALLGALVDHATQERFQYRHEWRERDMIIWDDRCSMHQANTDYDMAELRYMHRLMLEGGPTA